MLAPLLFNLYISDLPETRARKFIYADDIALVTQSNDFNSSEAVLTSDLQMLETFLHTWRLKINVNKTESTTFHLSNKYANYRPQIEFRNHVLQYNHLPKYLGVTLDRSLTYKQHLTKMASKLKTRNNVLHKLSGTSWGANAPVLKTTALSLVYSVAEYCCPVWANSAHTNIIDTQLNEAMRTISGTVKSTPTQWLPVLSNIEPPEIRRQAALKKEWGKCSADPDLPLHQDCLDNQRQRLKSRRPSWKLGERLIREDFLPQTAWQNEWYTSNPDSANLIIDPSHKPPGFNLPRRTWTTLNRIRTGHGRCQYMKHKWGISDDASCDCGHQQQTTFHIVTECPLRKFPGTMSDIHEASEEAVDWMKALDIHL